MNVNNQRLHLNLRGSSQPCVSRNLIKGREEPLDLKDESSIEL